MFFQYFWQQIWKIHFYVWNYIDSVSVKFSVKLVWEVTTTACSVTEHGARPNPAQGKRPHLHGVITESNLDPKITQTGTSRKADTLCFPIIHQHPEVCWTIFRIQRHSWYLLNINWRSFTLHTVGSTNRSIYRVNTHFTVIDAPPLRNCEQFVPCDNVDAKGKGLPKEAHKMSSYKKRVYMIKNEIIWMWFFCSFVTCLHFLIPLSKDFWKSYSYHSVHILKTFLSVVYSVPCCGSFSALLKKTHNKNTQREGIKMSERECLTTSVIFKIFIKYV